MLVLQQEISELGNGGALSGQTTVDQAAWLFDLCDCANQDTLPAKQRLTTLGHLHRGFGRLLPALQRQCRQLGGHAPETKLRTARALLSLYGVLADGYKLALVELANQGTGRNRSQQAALMEALVRAMCVLTEQIHTCYRIYEHVPNGVWQDLHQIYQFTERQGWLETIVAAQEGNLSIDQYYKRILLLALCNPYQLMPGDAERLYKLLGDWSQHCDLAPISSQSPAGKCFLELNSDKPPRRLRLNEEWHQVKPVDGRFVVIDDLMGLLDRASEALLQSQIRGGKSTLESRTQRNLLLRLAHFLGQRCERRSPRTAGNGKIEVATGIVAAHQLLAIPSDPPPENLDPSEIPLTLMDLDVIELLAKGAIQSLDAATADVPDFPNATVSHASPKKPATSGKQTASEVLIRQWAIRDRSADGLGVEFGPDMCNLTAANHDDFSISENAVADMRVGDLISYRDPEQEDAPWHIGDIRWMKRSDGQQVTAGIRKLGEQARTARASGVQGVGSGCLKTHALLLPPATSGLGRPRVLLANAIYDVDSVLDISNEEGVQRIRLVRLLDASNGFNQFEYQIISDK